MSESNHSDSETEATVSYTPQRGGKKTEKMTEYEKQRMKRIEENKARMKAMGLDKMASSFMGSLPISEKVKRKGKKKVGVEDDEEYMPSAVDEGSSSSSGSDKEDEFCASRTKPKLKTSTPSKKISKLSGISDFVDDDDEALMKAIALSLQDSSGFLDVESKTPRTDANASNAENFKRKQSVREDDSGKRKRKNTFTSRVQMTEDELILHFFQFDEAGKGGMHLHDLQRVAALHDFTWKDEEMEHMIHLFDSDGDGKLSLEDFTKIVERCNMRQGPENAERASMAS